MFKKIVRFFVSIIIVLIEPFSTKSVKFLTHIGISGEGAASLIRGSLYQFYWFSKRLRIGSSVKLVNPQNIILADNVTLHSNGSYIASKAKKIKIGKNSHVGRYSLLAGTGGITIGDNCAVSGGVIIYSVTNTFSNRSLPVTEQVKKAEVIIGNNILIGAGVIILPGVNIGNNAIIGAGRMVNKDVPANKIVGGVPVRVIGERVVEAKNEN